MTYLTPKELSVLRDEFFISPVLFLSLYNVQPPLGRESSFEI